MISSLKTCTPIRKVPVFSDPRVTGYFVNKSNARWFCPLAVKISDYKPYASGNSCSPGSNMPLKMVFTCESWWDCGPENLFMKEEENIS